MLTSDTASRGAVKRFGAEVFENGTSAILQLIPMDVPAGAGLRRGAGGMAWSIDLWGGVSQRIYRVVDREGRVSLPEVGPLLVSGKSLAEVQANLQETLLDAVPPGVCGSVAHTVAHDSRV